jgi:hypothetical protein
MDDDVCAVCGRAECAYPARKQGFQPSSVEPECDGETPGQAVLGWSITGVLVLFAWVVILVLASPGCSLQTSDFPPLSQEPVSVAPQCAKGTQRTYRTSVGDITICSAPDADGGV